MISTSILGTLLSWALLQAPLEAEEATQQGSGGGGSITGRVTVPVTKVKKRTLRGSAYRSRLSGGAKETGKRRGAKSPFNDVVVSVHPLSFTVIPEAVPSLRVDQEKVSFVPRVLPLTVGSTVEFVNKDKVYHNVFSLTPGAAFNIGRKRTGFVHAQKIEAVGAIELFCDIHPQMTATILSLDTPYYTTPDSTGTYVIEGLPSGEYEIRVFHPAFASDAVSVHLKEGARVQSYFELSP
jgi:plastocyanin